jgi:hypothetical protein
MRSPFRIPIFNLSLRVHQLPEVNGEVGWHPKLGLATSLKPDFLRKAAEYFSEHEEL